MSSLKFEEIADNVNSEEEDEFEDESDIEEEYNESDLEDGNSENDKSFITAMEERKLS